MRDKMSNCPGKEPGSSLLHRLSLAAIRSFVKFKTNNYSSGEIRINYFVLRDDRSFLPRDGEFSLTKILLRDKNAFCRLG